MAQPEDGGAVHRRRQNTENRRGRIGAREQPFVDALLKLMLDVVTEIPHKAETLPVAADARHRAVDENQRKIFRLFFAERVKAPQRGAHLLQRRRLVVFARAMSAKKLKALLR